ncbi:MAG: IS1595 family transposase [Gemmatimonadota bacterium]|nr:IS1595 family transposase [Gemmatimonadota bacterium]
MAKGETSPTGSGPGKSFRKGMSLIELMNTFNTEEKARKWYEKQVWPQGPYCPKCGTYNVQSGIKHPTMTHRCRECPNRKMFSVRTGTILQSSKLSFRVWVISIYLFTTGIKGTSSMKLHRDLEITYKSAWHLSHRLRKAFETETPEFAGPVEVDEAFFGGLEGNKHAKKKTHPGGGVAGKTAVVGIKDQDTGQVHAEVTPSIGAADLQGFIHKHTTDGVTVYTDDHKGYNNMKGVKHQTVKHSVGEYVNEQATINGMESFWALMKRGYHGIYHHWSDKHMERYIDEFEGRYNARELDTIDQMRLIAMGMHGKRLKYNDLIA